MIEDVWLKLIQAKVKKYLPSSRAFIFGSRALNTNRAFSDVDIGVINKQKIKGSVSENLSEELENSPLPYRINLVNFQTVSQQFKKVALKKIINLWRY